MTLKWTTLFGQRDVRETATKAIGTTYLSIPGTAFFPALPATQAVEKSTTYMGAMNNGSGGTIFAVAPVMLPHNAVVTAVIVYMSVSTRTWNMHVSDLNETSTTSTVMATTTTNSEDTTITAPTIDNINKKYFINIASIGNAEVVAGARITYTI